MNKAAEPSGLPIELAALPDHRRRTELAHIIWKQLGIRVHPAVDGRSATELLWYKLQLDALKQNPSNVLRDELIAFIQEHEEQLSLPCDGNCYNHTDAKVLQCYLEYQRDNTTEDLNLDITGGTM